MDCSQARWPPDWSSGSPQDLDVFSLLPFVGMLTLLSWLARRLD